MIKFTSHSGVFVLETELLLPISVEEAWLFFSNPENLKTITPPKMGFEITSKKQKNIFPGQLITYKVSIFSGIRSNWVTEITNVKENDYFIDEQRFGPYKMWHHEHHFEATENGVLMTDKVVYKLPFWFLGKIAHSIFVKSQLRTIFSYRTMKLKELFMF